LEDGIVDAKELENVYKRNLIVIKRQLKGLTHADSLIQPPVRGNCLNFVLGHVAASRQSVLKVLGVDSLMGEEHIDRYTREADPVTEDGDDVMTLDQIMDVMDKSQKAIAKHLLKLSEDDLSKKLGDGDEKTTVGMRIEFLSWHEAYHTGQTEYLRQLAGTDDKVI
jgi:uncharacterized damage-inducible protein DinB